MAESENQVISRLATLEAQLEALGTRIGDGFASMKDSMDGHKEDVKHQEQRMNEAEKRIHELEVASEVGKMKFVVLATVGSTILSIGSSLAVFFLTK